MSRLLQKQTEKLKNTENSLVVSVLEVHLKTIHEWVNKTWGYAISVFHTDTGITTGTNPGVQNSKRMLKNWSIWERATRIILRLENNFKMRFQLFHLFCLSKRLWDDLVIAKKYPWKNTSQALCQLHKDIGKSNGWKLKLDKSKLKVMYHVFIHQSSESLGQYTRKIAGKGAFLKTDFWLNLWLDWECYRDQNRQSEKVLKNSTVQRARERTQPCKSN